MKKKLKKKKKKINIIQISDIKNTEEAEKRKINNDCTRNLK